MFCYIQNLQTCKIFNYARYICVQVYRQGSTEFEIDTAVWVLKLPSRCEPVLDPLHARLKTKHGKGQNKILSPTPRLVLGSSNLQHGKYVFNGAKHVYLYCIQQVQVLYRHTICKYINLVNDNLHYQPVSMQNNNPYNYLKLFITIDYVIHNKIRFNTYISHDGLKCLLPLLLHYNYDVRFILELSFLVTTSCIELIRKFYMLLTPLNTMYNITLTTFILLYKFRTCVRQR